MSKKRKGKLIVIDGTDGSGKATQSEILIKRLKKIGKKVRYIDFPRYEESFYGKFLRRYLDGEFGEMKDVNPYLISIAYAADRHLLAEKINKWLDNGDFVISNRYTSASMAHQTARVKDNKKGEFLAWIQEMEYEVNELPKEDIMIFLNVPMEVSQKLMYGRKKDIAEKNTKHQKEALKVYLKLSEELDNWKKIECCDRNGKLQAIEEVSEKIWKEVEKIVK